MQAGGFLNYRLKYCLPKVSYCICQPNDFERGNYEKSGGQTGGQAKFWGSMAYPGPP